MKITIQSYNNTFTWESAGEDDICMQDLVSHLKGLLVASGYHPKNVDECFSPDAFQWFPEENNQEQ